MDPDTLGFLVQLITELNRISVQNLVPAEEGGGRRNDNYRHVAVINEPAILS